MSLLRTLADVVLSKTAEEHKLQGHTEVQGIPVAIENRKGSVREGTTEDGHHWRTKMKAPYGYIKGTKGKDGEEVDTYVGPDKDAPKAYVVHQHKPDGTGFDEDKVMLGFRSKEEARKTYLEHYDDPKFLGPISTVPVEELKEKIEKGGVLRKIADAVAPETHNVREVRGNCGPASLRIALRQQGLDVPEKLVAKATKTTEDGTTPEDIARVSGAKVVDQMPLGQLKKLTDAGTPVIVAYQDGPARSDQNGHYSVVSKVDEKVHLSDPSSRKPIREVPTDQFAARWHDVDKEGKERPQLGIVMRKLAAQVLPKGGEYAPGIPSARETHPIPRVFHDKPETWHMAVQHHEAEKAGPHIDLRLVDKRGLGHSWAIPKASLPKPGEKVLAVQQPTHTREYAARKGTFELPEGYGKGTVRSSGLTPVEVVRSQPGILRFNVYGGSKEGNQEFALIKTDKGHLLHNISTTAEAGVRGAGGHPIPQSKPNYREVHTDKVRFDDAEEIHQAKVDGAHVTFHLRGDKGVKVFSYRPTERATGVLEHTHKLPDYRTLTAPPGLAGTVLRGELYAADTRTGKALPAEQVGGLLNSTVWRSREKQKELGAELRPVIFDVVKHQGRDMADAPYSEKLQVLREVQHQIPRLKLPPTATTPAEKEDLFHRIRTGKEPITNEGIVAWKLPYPYPTKAKFKPDVDAEVVGVTPGKGKHEGRIGALQVRLPGKDAITHVGTGLSDELRDQIAKKPEEYIGRVAKVRTMQVFPSGRLRAPAFAGFHLEKGKQSMEETKTAMLSSYLGKLAEIDPKQVRQGTPLVGSFEEFKRKLRVGDVILTKPGDSGQKEVKDRFLGGAVRAYDWLSGAKHRGWAHTAMYLGKGEIAHLYDRKLRSKGFKPEDLSRVVRDKVDVFKPQGYDLVAIRPIEGARSAAEKMKEFVGQSVGITVPTFIKNLVRTGITPFKGRKLEDAVCSGIVGEAFTETPLAKRQPFSMRPKDLLESRKVRHLVAFSPDTTLEKAASLRAVAQRVLGGK